MSFKKFSSDQDIAAKQKTNEAENDATPKSGEPANDPGDRKDAKKPGPGE